MGKRMAKETITFCELFAGIGGFRLGLEKVNYGLGRVNVQEKRRGEKVTQGVYEKRKGLHPVSGERTLHKDRRGNELCDWGIDQGQFTCVYANEWDKYAAQIYNKNFKSRESLQGTERGSVQPSRYKSDIEVGGDSQPKTWGDREFQQSQDIDTRDIRTVTTSEIPDHDLLTGGVPCQAWSIAGKRKGFDDERGSLWFECFRILKAKQPKYFILENVKGILSQNKGRAFEEICEHLCDCGYAIDFEVLNSKDFGVPQNRERVFIVGVRLDLLDTCQIF
jgi:site-specific DNA-cytosine methylase